MQTLRTHNGIEVYVRNSQVVAYLLYGVVNERAQCSELIHLRNATEQTPIESKWIDSNEGKKIIDFQTTRLRTENVINIYRTTQVDELALVRVRIHRDRVCVCMWSEWKTVDHQLEQCFRLFAIQLHHFQKP